MNDKGSATSTLLSSLEFHQLFIENQPRVYAFIRKLLPVFEDSQEVFQNTCVIILGKADQFVPGTSFARWACQIGYYEACNYRRRRHKDGHTFAPEVFELLATEQLERTETPDLRFEALKFCLDKLRPTDRKLLEARYSANKSAVDLAAELVRPLATIKKSLQRLRRNLQHCIERALLREERST